MKIENCTITGNSATTGDIETQRQGGGIRCYASSPVITNCTISGNESYKGGGINCRWYSSPTITNCTITDNIASSTSSKGYGGGIWCAYYSSPSITHCTIAENNADTKGGGILCGVDSSPTVTNCILWGDSASQGPEIYIGNEDYPSTLTVSYSDVQGGQSAAYVESGCTLSWGSGNIDSDPLFIDASNGDYHLSVTSPCIDAGTNAGIDTDIDGQYRPMGAGYDMGADENLNGISMVRERAADNNHQRLNIYYAPDDVAGEILPLIASDDYIGKAGIDLEVTHFATGEYEQGGDGVDEIFLIKLKHLGDPPTYIQRVVVYEAPVLVGENPSPIAADYNIGIVGTDTEITHFATGNFDSDNEEELYFVRCKKASNNDQYLEIYDDLDGWDIGDPIASDNYIGEWGENNEITHFAAGNYDGDADSELFFIREYTGGNQRLNIHDAPE